MSRQELRDNNYNIMGYIDKDGDRYTAYDRNYNIVGYYQDGRTYDRNWTIVANGDVLSGLIYDAR
ncbi:MAG TPA: hypothetical protein DEP42_00105 [Ruminococcaceae bacterium]|nr:hypothetical protein [Oscillospiraceae bacterium]